MDFFVVSRYAQNSDPILAMERTRIPNHVQRIYVPAPIPAGYLTQGSTLTGCVRLFGW
jgi:hypothetical protein